MFTIKAKTEKFLLASIAILCLGFFVTAFSFNYSSLVSAEEGSESSNEKSEESKSSEKSEDSEEDEKSESSSDDEVSEKSENSEKSEESVVSSSSVKQELSTASTKSVSSKSPSTISETSEVSEKSEISEQSELFEESEMSEDLKESENTIESIKGFDEVVSVEGNTAIVKKNEKLFFLIPVGIESKITLDEEGNIMSKKQNFWNKLISIFSF